ncbi:hypothetical protein QT972_06695 [Microcoleus sp. herbarium7]
MFWVEKNQPKTASAIASIRSGDCSQQRPTATRNPQPADLGRWRSAPQATTFSADAPNCGGLYLI